VICVEKRHLALAVIVLLALVLRLASLQYAGVFYESDVFYYFSILSQAHGLALPALSAFDLMPPAESLGLYAGPLALHLIGLPMYWAVALAAPLAGTAIVLLTYLFAEEVSEDRRLALLSAFLIAASPAMMTKTMALTFRGDSFVLIPTLLSLILLCRLYKADRRSRKAYLLAVAAGVSAASAFAVWSGGGFAVAAFMFTILFLSALALPQSERSSSRLFLMAVAAESSALALLVFIASGLTQAHSPYLIPLMLALVILGAVLGVADAVLPKAHKRSQSALIICFTGLLLIALPLSTINTSLLQNGAISEMLPPSITYFIASYGLLLISPAIAFLFYADAPLALFLAGGFAVLVADQDKQHGIGAFALLSLLIITMALNISAIRYNMLASVPVAIFAAWTMLLLWDKAKAHGLLQEGGPNAPTVMLPDGTPQYNTSGMLPKFLIAAVITAYLFMAFAYVALWRPANNINDNYTAALSYIRNSTPPNSTILTAWTDGSEVEGFGQRYSYADSVAGGGGSNITDTWLLSSNSSLSAFVPRPDYIMVRRYYINESIGFCEQYNIPKFNCSKAVNASSEANFTYLKLKQPNFYVLLNACSEAGCIRNMSGYGAELVYENGDSMIYKVV